VEKKLILILVKAMNAKEKIFTTNESTAFMRSLRMFGLFAIVSMVAWVIPHEVFGQQASVSFQLFYDELSPYGTWVDYPNYGYVWIPNGETGFSPYATAGHWVFTDDGWTWVSDYPWGWAAFHYGRWEYDDVYGWFWVPDNEWGPAWVSWRRSPGYYGWVPLRPGISISVAFGSEYHERNERWIFVRDRDITRSDIGRHYVNRTNNVTIINNSTVIVNTRKDNKRGVTYIAGPNRDDVQKVTNVPVRAVVIRENDKPGQRLSNNELQIYRPQVQKANGNGHNPAPSKVMKLNEVKPISERTVENRQPQPRMVNPPSRVQPPQQRVVNPPNLKVGEQQSRTINPPNKVQSQKQQVVNPSNSRVKGKQPQKVNAPTKKVQPVHPRVVNPPNNRGKEKQPQNIVSPNKNQERVPRTNQSEKENHK
jgi:hypothetical protein